MAGLTIDRADVFPQHFEIGRNRGEKLGASGNKAGQVSEHQGGNQGVSCTIWRPPAAAAVCQRAPKCSRQPAILVHCALCATTCLSGHRFVPRVGDKVCFIVHLCVLHTQSHS